MDLCRHLLNMKVVLFLVLYINLGISNTLHSSEGHQRHTSSSAEHHQHQDPPDGSDTAENEIYDSDESNLLRTPLDRGPYFDLSASKNITALVGKTAYLNCRVRNLGNKTVSWVRHRDIHLLTVGRFTYTSDQRFQCVHNLQTDDWSLQIRYPQKRDTGVYECQISTTPPVGHSMYLSVVEPVTIVVGGPDIYINTGSTVNLTCVVRNSPEPPSTIIWTHNNQEINYDSPRGGVSVITEKGETTTSYLLIQRAKGADSGKYVCSPSNANSYFINVHILNGEHPEAMQHGGQLRIGDPLHVFVFVIITLLLGNR
ncbi:zwei Ig domain protein zig-8-like [Malaya genurostris]|uniref:zwei Ig domain protein zig-8-like n=1 Tax=Malaya genurostris TaxID=325434 RepID=UPI0026F394BC|nr:zwei Ig domain protein zig-8-like [Malaya genurostris]